MSLSQTSELQKFKDASVTCPRISKPTATSHQLNSFSPIRYLKLMLKTDPASIPLYFLGYFKVLVKDAV